MVATYNQHSSKDDSAIPSPIKAVTQTPNNLPKRTTDANTPAALLLPSRIITHTSKAGLNPLADAASYLFSVLGKLKQAKSYRNPSKLQTELTQEINLFQETIKNDYNSEYIIVCRYILCAIIDDILAHTAWGNQWEHYSLLAVFNQDTQHQDKFFNIMERAIKDPVIYIDLMELMYIGLSLGYKGQYRATEHNQYQLEQITNTLYKHIRAYRGSFSKTLSPTPLKASRSTMKTPAKNTSLLFIFFITACIIMTIFVSLGYLMDVITNEAYKNISQIQSTVADNTAKY